VSQRRLIIHVGMHKAASTSIQRFLFANRDRLRERGVLYPAGPCIDPPHEAHHALAWAIRGRPGYDEAERWGAAMDVIHSDPSPIVVFSSEDFEKFTADEVARLAAHVEGFDVCIVQVIRNAWAFLVSNYKHNVRYTATTETFRTFIEREAARCDFAARTELWSAAFGPGCVEMPILDKLTAADRDGVVRYVADLIAPELWPELGAPDADRHLNVGVHDTAVRPLRTVNRLSRLVKADGATSRIGSTVSTWKARVSGSGSVGRAVQRIDDLTPGAYWKPADRDWLRSRVRAWNDAYLSHYAPAEDRSYLDV
jgi:hypothetical protein